MQEENKNQMNIEEKASCQDGIEVADLPKTDEAETTDLPKTDGAGMRSMLKKRFSAKRIALMGVFVALSYGVSFLEFPIFPPAPFLKLDFGNVFILLISLLLGPIEGIIVCVLKECLRLIGSTSGGAQAGGGRGNTRGLNNKFSYQKRNRCLPCKHRFSISAIR